jgi:hypothetical protein
MKDVSGICLIRLAAAQRVFLEKSEIIPSKVRYLTELFRLFGVLANDKERNNEGTNFASRQRRRGTLF